MKRVDIIFSKCRVCNKICGIDNLSTEDRSLKYRSDIADIFGIDNICSCDMGVLMSLTLPDESPLVDIRRKIEEGR